MTTYNTHNPLGSQDPRDLFDNAQNMDSAANSQTAEEWIDRLGKSRKTWHGIEKKANLDIATAVAEAVDVATAEAGGYRDESQQARDDAKAAAGAIGPIKFYDTYAKALADIANIPVDGLIEVSDDETQEGARTRYFKRTGDLLEFAVNLDQLRLDLEAASGTERVTYQAPGPGSVQMPLNKKLSEVRSARDKGARGDGVTEDTDALNSAFHDPVTLTQGVYLGNPSSVSKLRLRGIDAEIKKLDSSGNIIPLINADYSSISDIRLRANKGGNANASGHHIAVEDGIDMTFRDIEILGAEGKGAGLMFYPSSAPFQERIIVSNIRGAYNRGADGDGCLVLMTKVRNSVVTNILAKEFGRFGALELKDYATHNVVSSVIADGCVNGVTFGSETSNNPTLNILSNIIAKSPSSFGLHAGDGDNNLFNGAIVDCSGSEGSQIGAITNNGENNAFTDVLISGLSGTSPGGSTYVPYPVRFLPLAKNNYASTFAHYAADNLVTFAVGAVRNFVEIKHPGSRVDIFEKSSYITGRESIDASSNSNVLHAPALGMYFGTMSGRFEWRYKHAGMPASTLFSSDRFRFTGDGDIYHAIGGGSAAGVKLFKSNGEYRTLAFDSSDRLRLGLTKTAWVQFGTDSIVTSLDNTVALGQPSLRYSVLYAGTGTINTSDSREKTEPEQISDGVLDAWGDVQFIAYRWLHMVAEKGDSARVHYGLIAQQVRDAFIARGLDGTRYGLLCYDSWTDKYEPVLESRLNQSGEEELHETGEQRLVLAAGDRWGIRPDQCLFLEAAYQRRRCSRLEAEHLRMGDRLKRLEDHAGLEPLPQ